MLQIKEDLAATLLPSFRMYMLIVPVVLIISFIAFNVELQQLFLKSININQLKVIKTIERSRFGVNSEPKSAHI